mmetsp:Transcript_15936/g.26989  ORF Transcript_15936/g.26989 Transcript_15936/m.26989 type:complete len:254 (-) Transcript_15936:46-807(-)|eukprot:CAMPEP_0116544214 /NCGR_PEP_ID=MMETSP0397-20121206/1991_1 /TAXON_ID=216820 /ORGANISM="Cyclophora tenuis, Strain ECT3854" /LENGTH=253 /DNA_ID=CAMNT_0004068397 /DNA_START=43 /DNA_END=804 /DNA_ORIENTATION=-
MIKLYGVPLSQPFRAVAWTMLQHQIPFEIQIAVPGATTRVGSLAPSFVSKSRSKSGAVPLLEDGSFVLTESPAILSYLCERNTTESTWYAPPGTERKATIDSYMHWHHTGTRALARIAAGHLRPDLALKSDKAKNDQIAKRVLGSLENGWLEHDPYIAGPELSIADVLAYEEIAQAHLTGLLPQIDEFPRVLAWTQRMTQLPLYAESHTALTTLGDLSVPSDTPLPKRLAAATKAAMQAYKQAQETYIPSSKL